MSFSPRGARAAGSFCFGDIDSDGNEVVQYWYDAWGNHKVVNSSGIEITDPDHIGNLNPFRYRGYYYDRETGLYFLQTRYYDPEIGRFLNRDSVNYADPGTINGLNLYAYCLNNPVAYADPTGHSVFITTLVISIVAGAALKGAIDGVNAYNNGRRGWELFASIAGGVISGAAMGAIMALGGAAGLASTGVAIAGYSLSTGAALGISLFAGTVATSSSYLLINGLHKDKQITLEGYIGSLISGSLQSTVTFISGFIGGRNGLYNKLGNFSSISDFYINMLNNTGKINTLSAVFYGTSMLLGDTLTKTLYLSSSAAGARALVEWLCDMIFL